MTPEPNQNEADDLLRYYALLDSMNDAFGVVDGRGVFTYVNKRFGEMLEYSLSDMVGKPITAFMNEKNREILENNIKKRERGLASQYEIEWTTSGGRQIPTIVSGAPLHVTVSPTTAIGLFSANTVGAPELATGPPT